MLSQQSSHSRFPFASRLSRPDPNAPLFYSTAEDFHEEDPADEHEREVADFYALQRSRQHFARSALTESSELDEDDGGERTDGQNHDREERSRASVPRPPASHSSSPLSDASAPVPKGKARLEHVSLAYPVDEEPPESLVNLSPIVDTGEHPTPYPPFTPSAKRLEHSPFMPFETDEEAQLAFPRPPSPDRESVPPTVILPTQEPPKHDGFWANLFQIGLFSMFATFVLIWFHTSTPSTKNPLGDTIYSALRASTNMLLWDTMVAVIVALVWLSLLRHYVRPLVYTILVAVPIVLFTFSLYPFVSSFRGYYNGTSIQDRAMRWLSLLPALVATFWTYSVVTSRHSLSRAIHLLEFSTKILAASPSLVLLGFATLALVVSFTWIWMLMFERVFLSGHFTPAKKFLLDANSWWLGAFFVLQYLWSLGVIAGVQRATTAATVSQWYFHRLAVPQPSSRQVVRASLAHATGALSGTVCLSTFLSLLIRLPLLILPGRAAGLLNMCAYWIMPIGLATLTNPLTLTYAAVHSQPLGIAARGLAQLTFLSRPSSMDPRYFAGNSAGSASIPALVSYRLAKLLLQATRWIMSAALGISGWVRTARTLDLTGAAGIRGSLYAYVVGLLAGTIGFAVLGAIENVVGAVLDAAVICWASETGGRAGRGEARFCREAGELFGGEENY